MIALDCTRCEGSGHGEQRSDDDFAKCEDCGGSGHMKCEDCGCDSAVEDVRLLDAEGEPSATTIAMCEDCLARHVRRMKRDRARAEMQDGPS